MLRPLFVALCIACSSLQAVAETPQDVIAADLLTSAMQARRQISDQIRNPRYSILIDYRLPSDQRRMYVIDHEDDSVEQLLVAHGKGSDPDHDGFAEHFSNTPHSKMSSLGAFVTGKIYYGKHGLSLRLHGLEARNNKALDRAIVIHGADYVAPGRKLGRSWGCPALERKVAQRIIPLIAGGSFLYVTGQSDTTVLN